MALVSIWLRAKQISECLSTSRSTRYHVSLSKLLRPQGPQPRAPKSTSPPTCGLTPKSPLSERQSCLHFSPSNFFKKQFATSYLPSPSSLFKIHSSRRNKKGLQHIHTHFRNTPQVIKKTLLPRLKTSALAKCFCFRDILEVI